MYATTSMSTSSCCIELLCLKSMLFVISYREVDTIHMYIYVRTYKYLWRYTGIKKVKKWETEKFYYLSIRCSKYEYD
jgi:hypothetical protein